MAALSKPDPQPGNEPDGQRNIVAWLSTPAAYDLPASATVKRSETHGAIVFLAGDRAYKLKRAVKYPYLDYSTPEFRRAASFKELAVNQKMAPDLYLGVQAIVRDPGGRLHLADNAGNGTAALDWVVVMRRFNEDDLLEKMRASGRLTPALMRDLAETIADFHGAAERRPDYGGARAMAEIVDGNIKALQSISGSAVDPRHVEHLTHLSRAALERFGPTLDRRRDDGFVRRCHGDLHLNNICLIDGKPVLFDAIEFEESFASIDVLYDLAFLLMDLERHDLRPFANIVFNRYLERTSDYAGLSLLPLFLSCRAAIRAHVAVTRAQARGTGLDAAAAEARKLLTASIRYLEPKLPRLVAVGGASGTGKSTIARALAPAVGPSPGAVVVRSDVVRKQLSGVAETTRLPPSAYTAEAGDKIFSHMTTLAAEILEANHAVILDGVYREPRQRGDVEALARQARVRFDGVWLEAPPEVLASRIAARRDDASDATVDVMRDQLAHLFRPPTWVGYDASRPVDEIVSEIGRQLELSAYPKDLERSETVPGFGEIHMRPVRPDDAPAFIRFFERMSAEDVRRRFFAPLTRLPPDQLARLTQIDYDREMAFILEIPGPEESEIIAVGRLAIEPDRRRAEFAVAVRSDLKGRGFGRLLLARLVDYARQRDLEEIFGDILKENVEMLALSRELRFLLAPLQETAAIVRATLKLKPLPQK
jgi:aminoglycoside phosphotransferase family enzyme/predicted kinase/GNAT superfamily N-acetyltransferase